MINKLNIVTCFKDDHVAHQGLVTKSILVQFFSDSKVYACFRMKRVTAPKLTELIGGDFEIKRLPGNCWIHFVL